MKKVVTISFGPVYIGKRNPKCRYHPMNFNRLGSMHWATVKQWKDAWKEAVWGELMFVKKDLPKKLPLKFLEFEVIYLIISPMDEDNLNGSLKPIIDALKPDYFGLVEDDSPDHIKYTVRQEKVKKRVEQKVIINFFF